MLAFEFTNCNEIDTIRASPHISALFGFFCGFNLNARDEQTYPIILYISFFRGAGLQECFELIVI